MTSSELKYQFEGMHPASYFFDRKTLAFFGDTMKNYGVRETRVTTYDSDAPRAVYELYRKRAVKYGLKSSAYFDKLTLQIHHNITKVIA